MRPMSATTSAATRIATLAVGATLLLTAGCASSSPSAQSTSSARATVQPVGTPVPITAAPTAAALTASDVAKRLSATLPLKGLIVYTADTDPNHKLGRPGSYTGKAAWTDSRVHRSEVKDDSSGSVSLGGGVEIFSDVTAATARAKYIQAALQGLGGMADSEYDYVSGGILVRVSGNLTPALAMTYGAALGQITGSPATLVTP